MGSQGLMFSWLKPCFPWGKETIFAKLGWRDTSEVTTQLLCYSSGKVGNTLWFHSELILTSVTELFHSPLLNVFEISSEKSFLLTFLLLSFVFQSQDAALWVDLIMLGAQASHCRNILCINYFLGAFAAPDAHREWALKPCFSSRI